MSDDNKLMKDVPPWWNPWQNFLGRQQERGRMAAFDPGASDLAQDAYEAAWETATAKAREVAPILIPSAVCECGEPVFIDSAGWKTGTKSVARHPSGEGHSVSVSALRVGISGTRTKLSHAEKEVIRRNLRIFIPRGATIVTGGCVGVDAFVAEHAYQAERGDGKRIWDVHTIMPYLRSQADPNWRDYCDSWVEMGKGTTYKDRNIAIVLDVHYLIYFPKYAESDPRSKRSGTWQTYRLARAAGVPTRGVILSPSGMLDT